MLMLRLHLFRLDQSRAIYIDPQSPCTRHQVIQVSYIYKLPCPIGLVLRSSPELISPIRNPDAMESHRISTSLCFLSLMPLVITSCIAARTGPQDQSATEFIRTSCTATAYPELCVSSLSVYAEKIRTSPMQLAQTALSVSLAGARSASTALSKLPVGAGGVSPRARGATRDCVENMGNSVDELQQSLAAMGDLRGKDVGFVISSVQTWVSAALTDDETCMDGFAGAAMEGSVKSMVRSHVEKVAQLTSNALALVNGVASSRSP